MLSHVRPAGWTRKPACRHLPRRGPLMQGRLQMLGDTRRAEVATGPAQSLSDGGLQAATWADGARMRLQSYRRRATCVRASLLADTGTQSACECRQHRRRFSAICP